MYLFIASLANVLLGFQRGDETAYAGLWRVDQIMDLALVFCALAAGSRRWVGRRRPDAATASNG